MNPTRLLLLPHSWRTKSWHRKQSGGRVGVFVATGCLPSGPKEVWNRGRFPIAPLGVLSALPVLRRCVLYWMLLARASVQSTEPPGCSRNMSGTCSHPGDPGLTTLSLRCLSPDTCLFCPLAQFPVSCRLTSSVSCPTISKEHPLPVQSCWPKLTAKVKMNVRNRFWGI